MDQRYFSWQEIKKDRLFLFSGVVSLLPLFKIDTVKKKIINNLHFWIFKKGKKNLCSFFSNTFSFFVKLSKS